MYPFLFQIVLDLKKKRFSLIIFPKLVKSDYLGRLNVLIMSRTFFRVNSHSIVAWVSRKSLLETGAKSEV